VQEVHVHLHSGRECHYCWHLAPKYNIKPSIVSPLLPDKNSKLIRSPGDYQHTQAPLSHTPPTHPHHIPTVHVHTHHTHMCDGYVVRVWEWSTHIPIIRMCVMGTCMWCWHEGGACSPALLKNLKFSSVGRGAKWKVLHVRTRTLFSGWDVNNRDKFSTQV